MPYGMIYVKSGIARKLMKKEGRELCVGSEDRIQNENGAHIV